MIRNLNTATIHNIGNAHNQTEFLLLHDKYTVSKHSYDAVKFQVIERLPTLDRYKKYTAESLCGADFWQQLHDGEGRLAGRCLADMVFNGTLPLVFAGKTKSNSLLYKLK